MVFVSHRVRNESAHGDREGWSATEDGTRPTASSAPAESGSDLVVRHAGEADIARVVDVLVQAFEDDPVVSFAFSGLRHARRGLRRLFTIQLRYEYLPHGEVITNEHVTGAALWAPAIRIRPSWQNVMFLLPVVPYLQRSHSIDTLRLLGRLDEARPKEPHWYLATLGTEPTHQGCGVGSALLRPVLARLDEADIPAYLECSKEENVDFYTGHGFEVVGELGVPNGGPRVWLMWRGVGTV